MSIQKKISRICEICSHSFIGYKTTRSCSKKCKNEIARRTAILQFSNPENKLKTSLAVKSAMSSPEGRKNFERGMASRRSYAKEGHPRWGVTLTDDTKSKIGKANKGRFKGKTWEDMYGVESAKKRRISTAKKMAKTNAKLLKSRTSKLEKSFIKELSKKGYKNNQRINHYVVDFLNAKTKHIIEIYGDYWHANPSLYKEDYFNISLQLYARDIWKRDKIRIAYLKSLGYTIQIKWERDIKK